jgi:hypothetical protein
MMAGRVLGTVEQLRREDIVRTGFPLAMLPSQVRPSACDVEQGDAPLLVSDP